MVVPALTTSNIARELANLDFAAAPVVADDTDSELGDAQLPCGLLEPSGEFHECNYYGHYELSRTLLQLRPVLQQSLIDPEPILLGNGWVKISGSPKRTLVLPTTRLTQPQLDFLLTHRKDFTRLSQLEILEEANGQWR